MGAAAYLVVFLTAVALFYSSIHGKMVFDDMPGSFKPLKYLIAHEFQPSRTMQM
jgi:hypothetical protein